MKVINENLSITDFEAWSGAKDTKQIIIDNDKENDFDFMIEDLYPDGLTDTALNDLLWHDSDWVLEQLGIEIED
jgi:hypothetical protein